MKYEKDDVLVFQQIDGFMIGKVTRVVLDNTLAMKNLLMLAIMDETQIPPHLRETIKKGDTIPIGFGQNPLFNGVEEIEINLNECQKIFKPSKGLGELYIQKTTGLILGGQMPRPKV